MNIKEDFLTAPIFATKEQRQKIAKFYKYARQADNVADNPELSQDEKMEKLEQLKNEYDNKHFHDLLNSFFHDSANELPLQTYNSLMTYTSFSAAPVGLFLLETFNEEITPAITKASAALSSALQLLNHLRDIHYDYHVLNRTYIPENWLNSIGLSISDLADLNPEKSDMIDICHDIIINQIADLIAEASVLRCLVKNKSLRLMTEAIISMAEQQAIAIKKHSAYGMASQLTTMQKTSSVLRALFYTYAKAQPTDLDYMRVKSRVKLESSSFYYSMMKLDYPKRRLMYGVYALCSKMDNIADDISLDTTIRMQGILDFKNLIAKLYDGTYDNSLPELNLIADWLLENTDKTIFDNMVRSLIMDINAPPIAVDEQALKKYIEGVSGTVGIFICKILNVPENPEFIENLSEAIQEINIIRDLKEDQILGRLYIAKEDLEKFDIPVPQNEQELHEITNHANFLKLYAFLCQRASDKIEKAIKIATETNMANSKDVFLIVSSYQYYIRYLSENPAPHKYVKIKIPLMEKLKITYQHTF